MILSTGEVVMATTSYLIPFASIKASHINPFENIFDCLDRVYYAEIRLSSKGVKGLWMSPEQ